MILKRLIDKNFNIGNLPNDIRLAINKLYELTNDTLESDSQKVNLLDKAIFDSISVLYPNNALIQSIKTEIEAEENKINNDSFNTTGIDEGTVINEYSENTELIMFSDGGNTELLAPNGKPSNLTPEQYKLVRTPEFKAWFGDWEKLAKVQISDPAIDTVTLSHFSKDVSKVLDENGEPLIVWHGSKKEFTVFGEGKNENILPEYKEEYEYRKKTNYFHKDEEYTKVFGSKYGGQEKPYFLNIKKIELVDEESIEDAGYYDNIYNYFVTEKGLDGIYSKNGQYATLLSPNQIKLADGTNTTFDDNPDIRYADGNEISKFGDVSKKNKFIIESREGEEDRTTIILKNIGKVVLVETFPEYEFMEDITEDELVELGLSEGDMIGKIEHLEINDDYKGKGYAKLLMEKAIEIAKDNGLMPIYLNASPMGTKGLGLYDLTKFYEKFGFRVFKKQGGNNLMILDGNWNKELKNKYNDGGNVINAEIIGHLTTKPLKYESVIMGTSTAHEMPAEKYAIISTFEQNNHTFYVTNQWYDEYKKKPLIIVDDMVDTYEPIKAALIKTTVLNNFQSGSSLDFYENNIFVIGDDTRDILQLNTEFKEINRVNIFKNEIDQRIAKDVKSDLETSTVVNIDGITYILILGSGSRENRAVGYLLNPDLNVVTERFKYNRFVIRLNQAGIKEVNIEGSAVVGDKMLLVNRGNKTNPDSFLIVTDHNFYDNEATATIFLSRLQLSDKDAGVSEIYYDSQNDILFLTATVEDTTNAYDDGKIGDSYLGYVRNISKKLNQNTISVDKLIKLTEISNLFNNQKIEGICVEGKIDNYHIIDLVSDNDNEESHIFKIKINIDSWAEDGMSFKKKETTESVDQYTKEKIEKAYVSIRIPDQTAQSATQPGKYEVTSIDEKPFAELKDGVMNGIRGISTSNYNISEWLVHRDALIVMPFDKFNAINETEQVKYFDADYLTKNGLEVLFRLYDKKQSDDNSYSQILNNIFPKISQEFKLEADANNNNLFYSLSTIFDIYNSSKFIFYIAGSPRINSPKMFAELVCNYVNSGLAKEDYYYYYWPETSTVIQPEDIVTPIINGIVNAGKIYRDESEWIIKDQSLNIPEGSQIFFVLSTYLNQKEQYEKMITAYGLRDKYKVYYVNYKDIEKFQQMRFRRKREVFDKELSEFRGVVNKKIANALIELKNDFVNEFEKNLEKEIEQDEYMHPQYFKNPDGDKLGNEILKIDEVAVLVTNYKNKITDALDRVIPSIIDKKDKSFLYDVSYEMDNYKDQLKNEIADKYFSFTDEYGTTFSYYDIVGKMNRAFRDIDLNKYADSIKSRVGSDLYRAFSKTELSFKDGGKTFNDKELLAKYKRGQSIGFTGIAHLKAKGLIPRADGTKRKSEKYK